MVWSNSCCGAVRPLARGIVLGGALLVAFESLQAATLRLPAQPYRSLFAVAVLLLVGLELRSRVGGSDAEPVGDGGGVAVGEHYRAIASAHEDGIAASEASGGVYRVVGAGDPVALLRVTDGDGRRRHTGELVRVSPDAFDDAFDPAIDPDAGLSPVRGVRNQLQGLYWAVRRFF